MTYKQTKADKAYHKFLEMAEKKKFVIDGAVGDKESWSCAVFPEGTPANTRYAIVDYSDWDDEGMDVQWFDLTDEENIIEEKEMGKRKTPRGVLSLIEKQFKEVA
jgi:hypothetical protein